jgi:hypothetical protein
MKTSPELLSDILITLTAINGKMDALAAKPAAKGDTTVKIGSAGVIGSLLGKKGAAEKLADDVEKLKSAMKGLNLVRLNKLIVSLKEYQTISKENSSLTKVSGWALAAQDMGKALIYIGAGIATFALTFGLAKKILGVSPYEVLGFIGLTSLTLAASMAILAGGEASGDKFAGFLGGKAKTIGNAKADKGRTKSAIASARDMGTAMMYIAGGILGFSTSLK